MEILRKITLKGVCGKFDFEKLLESPEKKQILMKVYGVARKAKPDSSELGPFVPPRERRKWRSFPIRHADFAGRGSRPAHGRVGR